MSERFPRGRLLMSRGVADGVPMDEVIDCIRRHCEGDWGDVCDDDKAANERALVHGDRLLSAYVTSRGRIYVITEADRSATTALFTHEY